MAIARATGGFLAQVKALLDRLASIVDDGMRETQLDTLRKVNEILQMHAEQENSISVDRRLSEKGQEEKVIELAKSTLAKLKFLSEREIEADMAYTRLEAVIFTIPKAPEGNEVVQFLREQEIRSFLRGFTPAERMLRYIQAVERDDKDMIRAFRLAPGESLIPNDIRERVDRERHEQTNPSGVTKLSSLDVMRQQLHELNDSLVQWLRGYGAQIKFETPAMKSAQWLVGYGHEVKFGTPNITPPPAVSVNK